VWPKRKKEPDEAKWAEMNKMVVQLITEKKIDEAQAVADELFTYSKDAWGKGHSNTATALNNLGFVSIMKRDFDKAESYLLMALEVSEKAHGKDSKECAVVYMNLAKLYVAKAREIHKLENVFHEQLHEEAEVAERMKMRSQN
jgi:hypothetical protein